MLNGILYALALMAGLGLLFGVGLSVASKKLAIDRDPRIDAVRDCLPGANCGGCGYPGCEAYATAIVMEGADMTLCLPGGQTSLAAVAQVMGVESEEAGEVAKRVANIICRGSCSNVIMRFDYQGDKTCRTVAITGEGDKSCRYACVGYGDCVAVCPFGALIIGDDRIVTVDESKCTGCGRCVRECPKNVIRIEPHYKVRVRCHALEKGKIVRESCTAGCIGCGKCEKSCKFGAIVMKDNLPTIDREKCVGCLECAKNCPTGAMEEDSSPKLKAYIHEDECIGCTLCKRECKFDAITGEVKKPHAIDREKCVGCGLCEVRCPKKVIEMNEGIPARKVKENLEKELDKIEKELLESEENGAADDKKADEGRADNAETVKEKPKEKAAENQAVEKKPDEAAKSEKTEKKTEEKDALKAAIEGLDVDKKAKEKQ